MSWTRKGNTRSAVQVSATTTGHNRVRDTIAMGLAMTQVREL